MKLSEKFLDRISHSTEFSKPVVLTKHVKLYGEIYALEKAKEIWTAVWLKAKGVNPKLEALSSDCVHECEDQLLKIAKDNNI